MRELYSSSNGDRWHLGKDALGLVAALLLVEAAAFAIASFGIALHWSCLIIAGFLAVAAAAAFFQGRSGLRMQPDYRA